jgi:Ankyrin repeats (3 copies)
MIRIRDLIVLDLQELRGVSIGDNIVLHIVATSSSDLIRQRPEIDYLRFADEVYNKRRSLLMARNKLMETPLHCAVKAGNYKMVSRMLSFAEREHQTGEETLLKEKNIHGETALHEAVRIGHRDIVNKLIIIEPSLMGTVDAYGVSPLYLATMSMNALDIIRMFTRELPSMVSCAGPKGQTALHAAVLDNTGMHYFLSPILFVLS